MKKTLIFLIALVVMAAPCHAALTDAAFISALGVSAPQYQQALSAVSNVKSSVQFAQYNTSGGQFGWYVSNSAMEILRPVGASSAELVAPMAKLAGSAGAKVILRKGLGLLGPVAVAVQIGMTLNDLYNEKAANSSLYPTLPSTMSSGVTPASPAVVVGSIVLVNGTNRTMTSQGTTVYQNNQAGHDTTYYNASNIQIHGPQCDGGASGNAGHYIYTFYFNSGVVAYPTPVPIPVGDYEELIGPAADGGVVNPSMLGDVDKVVQKGLTTGDALSSPSSSQTKILADSVTIAAAPVATQNAVNTAQTNYTNNPSPENKQILDTLLAQQAAQLAQQAKNDSLVAPPIPVNAYDASIMAPVKKEIPSLLATMVASSPLVSMVHSFTVSTSAASCSMPVGNYHGAELSFDFCHWQTALAACGGVLMILMHGAVILVVVRGW